MEQSKAVEEYCRAELHKMFKVETESDEVFVGAVEGIIKHFYLKGFKDGQREAKKERG